MLYGVVRSLYDIIVRLIWHVRVYVVGFVPVPVLMLVRYRCRYRCLYFVGAVAYGVEWNLTACNGAGGLY